jgi:hypothetical protein
MYTLSKANPFTGEQDSVIRDSDGAIIPFDPKNTDYQKYLIWISQGNTPNPCNVE